MPFVNQTPFPAELFEQINQRGTVNGVVSVRGTFAVRPEATLALARRQVPFVWSDTYAGDPLTTPLLAAGDLAPFKPGTDVTVLGASYAPEDRPQPHWTYGIEIPGRLAKRLRVTGPRNWLPQRARMGRDTDAGWVLSEPEPARETPLCWSQAYGGVRPATGGADAQAHPDNPLGVGRGLVRQPDPVPLPAPRIEDPDDPITDWRRTDYVPQGFAPIPPWWEVRRRHMGTVDEAWLETRHPLLPEDFDFAFWQSAHPDCVVRPWLIGGEVVTLTNLHPVHARLRFGLPAFALWVRLDREGRAPERYPALLDGVHIDLRAGIEQVYLTWRAGFPWPDGTGTVTLDGEPHG